MGTVDAKRRREAVIKTKTETRGRGRAKEPMKTQASEARSSCASLFVGNATAHFFERLAIL